MLHHPTKKKKKTTTRCTYVHHHTKKHHLHTPPIMAHIHTTDCEKNLQINEHTVWSPKADHLLPSHVKKSDMSISYNKRNTYASDTQNSVCVQCTGAPRGDASKKKPPMLIFRDRMYMPVDMIDDFLHRVCIFSIWLDRTRKSTRSTEHIDPAHFLRKSKKRHTVCLASVAKPITQDHPQPTHHETTQVVHARATPASRL
jgi:hypothetical protein